jgi:uncharacterized membrane protein (UPF0182 family)
VAMRPPIPNITLSRRARAALWTLGVLIVVIIALVQATGVYINWLWFGDVGYRGVYTTVFWTRVVLFFTFGIGMALIIGGNLVIAYVLRPPFRPMSAEQQNIERYRVMLEPRRILILSAIGVIALFSAGLSAQGNWSTWQLFLHGGSFGVTDPQFHKDISFYAWDYPAYRLLLGFGFTAVIFALILSAAMHYLTGAIRLQTPGPKITLAARRHLTILVFVFLVLKAIAYWLDRYGFVFSDRSKFTGASYTDVHAALPARTILFWIAILLAAGMIASLWLRSTLIPAIGFVAMLILSILISGIYPALVQNFSVKPNASSKEAPYILRNINATRVAYDITTNGTVRYIPYTASSQPDSSVLESTTNATLNNVRILDPNVIPPLFNKFQQLGGNVYGFAPKLDVDRYTIDGQEHDYIVGVRELDKAALSGQQTNWINQFTNYTHGYGFVAAVANSNITDTGNQAGQFTEGGIPQTGPLHLTNPAVYYGELMPDYSIVGAKGQPREFDQSGKSKVTYNGGGGVSLGSFFSRLAFAINYKQTNFLLNDAASANGAKIIFNRDPRVMVQKVAPFLKVDGDPYPIVDQGSGHIVWMVDGYTTMANYPYSARESLSDLTNDSLATTNKTAKQPDDTINYIRNSVKATVDAYTGQVKLYAWDDKDPVLKAWRSVFPGLVQDSSAMPTEIRDHVRYPEDLFEVQRAMLTQYHVDDPVTFYNVGDKWTVPDDPTNTSGSQPPYYILAAPPDATTATGDQSEFQLTSPMNVNSSTYLAAYMSVDNDPSPENYGKITVLRLPKGTQAVQGPEQVYNKITTDSTITKDLTFFNSPGGGSTVIHGNLLTLPLGNSFLYVEPLYNRSSSGTSGTYPVLVRVIAVYGDKIGYGTSLDSALSDFLPGHSTGQTLATVNSNPTGPTTTPTSGATPPPSSTSSSPTTTTTPPPAGTVTVTELTQAEAALQAALKSGDYEKIGAAQAKVNELLQQYLEQNPPATSSSPSPSGSSP